MANEAITKDEPITIRERYPLDEFPLAKAYGWRADKRHTGGMLYLYPPRTHSLHIAERRVNSLHPDELTPAARHWLDEHYALEPYEDD